MEKKRIFKIILLVSICFILLTGCKNQSGSTDSTLPDVANTEQAGVDGQETNIENAAQTETESANSTPKRKGPKYKADDAHKFFMVYGSLQRSSHSIAGLEEMRGMKM